MKDFKSNSEQLFKEAKKKATQIKANVTVLNYKEEFLSDGTSFSVIPPDGTMEYPSLMVFKGEKCIGSCRITFSKKTADGGAVVGLRKNRTIQYLSGRKKEETKEIVCYFDKNSRFSMIDRTTFEFSYLEEFPEF